MIGLEIDFETRSACDIRTEGVYRYMAHPTTRPLFCSYQIDAGPIRRWDAAGPCPADIVAYVDAGGLVWAHNSGFERLLWQMILTPRFGWPTLRLEQVRCTAATAAALALPRDLDGLGAVLDLPVKKDKAGKDLIRLFSIPRRALKADRERLGEAAGTTVLWTEPEDRPEEWAKFKDYCDDDVRAEAGARATMMPLSPACQEMHTITERINDRGLRIDVASAKAALRLVDVAKLELDRQMRELTDGVVGACSQVAQIVAYCRFQGVDMDSLAKADLLDALERDDLPAPARRALELRRDYAKSSTAKLKAFLARASGDQRIRGAFVFRAAGTGRYASRGAQLHNLPRYRKVFEDAHLDTDVLYDAFRKGEPAYLRLLYGDDLGAALPLISDAIRGFIWAAPGHDLLAADYSGIEGAIQAWVAGEEWKVKALFDIMADPSQPDMYRRAAAGIYNTTTDIITKKDPRRQVGKVSELSLGYQGGVGAFRSMARNYAMKLRPIFEPAWEAADPERRERADARYEECKARSELLTQQLTREEWIGCELVKVGWRAAHPATVKAWKALEQAARAAVDTPGEQVAALDGRIAFLRRKGFLWCRLPSGRCLAYGAPSVREVEVPWADKALTPALREKRPVVTCLGTDSQTGKLTRYPLYGGLLFENCLTGDTQVLTLLGWKRLDAMTVFDWVWDGLGWVAHSGLRAVGEREVLEVAGVRMTPDHKVWTNDGWVRAEHVGLFDAYAASPSPETDRRALRTPRGDGLCREQRREELLDGPLRLRHLETVCRFGTEKRPDAKLWVPRARAGITTREAAVLQTRTFSDQNLRRVARDDSALHEPGASCVQELRRAGDFCVRAVALLRRLLGRHGRKSRPWVDAGAFGQRKGLQSGKLRLARLESSSAQQEGQRHNSDACRPDAALRGRRAQRDREDDALLSGRGGLAGGEDVRPSGQHKPREVAAVYDLLNAGPLRRFTVKGEHGPVIVSNCVQAIALDLLDNGIRIAEAAGYPVIGHVHDEIITEVPRGWGDLAWFEEAICELPAWAAGLPLTASGWRGKRYRK